MSWHLLYPRIKRNDITQANALVADVCGSYVVADKGYDSDISHLQPHKNSKRLALDTNDDQQVSLMSMSLKLASLKNRTMYV